MPSSGAKKLPATPATQPFHGPGIKLSQFKIEGPFYDQWPPASFRAVYGSDTIPKLADPAAHSAVVQRFARRAFRRPIQLSEIQPYLTFFEAKHAAGNEWHEALIDTLAAMMTSVDFLYIVEGASPQGKSTNAKTLNPHELAARLSYFLRSSQPDAELSVLADQPDVANALEGELTTWLKANPAQPRGAGKGKEASDE